jgi:type I restriction-modification system DNA methylase subunit
MFLHGIDGAQIEWGDTLRNPLLIEQDHLMKFEVVVANPPFSLDKWGADGAENDRFRRFHRGVPPKSKGDYAFISHMIETAHPYQGRVGVIAPHGVLFRGGAEGKIRQQLIVENLLDAVIGLPPNLFYGTGIPAAILLFRRDKDARLSARVGVTIGVDAERGDAMTELNMLQSVQFVEVRGKRFALLSVEDWEALIEWLEDLEDTRLARAALADLKAAGGDRARAGWLKWEDVEQDWA